MGFKDTWTSMRVRRDWFGYLLAHERHERPAALLAVADELSDARYWKLVAEVFTDGEGRGQGAAMQHLLRQPRPGRAHLMTRAERRALAAMPDPIPVHRGFAHRNARGWSWTTDPAKAEWFALRPVHPLGPPGPWPKVRSGLVARADVWAYFAGRDESEIVVDPAQVREVTMRRLRRD